MAKTGVTLTDVWEFLQEHRLLRHGRNFADITEELLRGKKSAGVSEKYHFENSKYFSQFLLDREQSDIADITPTVLDA